jgi:SAM-dependent methyltransferase
MFEDIYHRWNERRIKGIVDFYGYKFFYGKKVLDLGCGYADMSGVLHRLGANVLATDARAEHLKIVSKKFPGIKTARSNLDGRWPFQGQKFDLIMDLGVLCHLSSFEAHLKAVCGACNYLVLETAVCDSDNPDTCLSIEEGKGIYDLSFSGMGCRPSPAAIERVLAACGMNFKRTNNSKYNAGDYEYDWFPQNNNTTNLRKRALWFASKTVIENEDHPPTPIITPSLQIPKPAGYIHPSKNSGIQAHRTASPRPPMSAQKQDITPPNQNVSVKNDRTFTNIPTTPELNKQVKKTSRKFSLITADTYHAETYSTSGVVFPYSHSSRMWLKKIAPLFPGLKMARSCLGINLPKAENNDCDLLMCDIDNLVAGKRIWMEEWQGALSKKQLDILRNCPVILTSSLVNAEELLKHFPDNQIIRCSRPWPAVENSKTEKVGHFLYCQKQEKLSSLLYGAWEENLGSLIVVGSSVPVPKGVSFVSDCVEYARLFPIIQGAKALIDLSDNTYYHSGLQELARALSVPVITNNLMHLDKDTIITQDKSLTAISIKQAVKKFLITPAPHKAPLERHNDSLNIALKKMLGQA